MVNKITKDYNKRYGSPMPMSLLLNIETFLDLVGFKCYNWDTTKGWSFLGLIIHIFHCINEKL